MFNPNQPPKVNKIEDKIKNTQDVFNDIQKEISNIEINEKDRSTEGKLLVFPDGPESNLSEENWKIVRTPSFKKWFEGSDVKDENGEPALVYHTTNDSLNDFENFSYDKSKIRQEEKNKVAGDVLVETGFYFTAGSYDYGKNRLSVFLNAKLKEIDKHSDIMNLKETESLKFQNQGYSGLVYTFKNTEDEINDLKKAYKRKHSPKDITDKIFYGFNQILHAKDYIDALLSKVTENKSIVESINSTKKHLSSNDLENIKHKSKQLIDVQKDAKSPFFEVCVFKPDQIMIIDKEEDYKSTKN